MLLTWIGEVSLSFRDAAAVTVNFSGKWSAAGASSRELSLNGSLAGPQFFQVGLETYGKYGFIYWILGIKFNKNIWTKGWFSCLLLRYISELAHIYSKIVNKIDFFGIYII